MPGATGSPLVLLLSTVSIVGTTPAARPKRHEAARTAAVLAGVCKRASARLDAQACLAATASAGTRELGTHRQG